MIEMFENEDYVVYGNKVRIDSWLRKYEFEEILSALKLQELIKEKIEEYESDRKQSWFPSKKRGMLYKKANRLRNLLEKSKTTVVFESERDEG